MHGLSLNTLVRDDWAIQGCFGVIALSVTALLHKGAFFCTLLYLEIFTTQRCILFFFFLRFYLFIFLERGREGGKEGEIEGEKHRCVVASCTPPTGDLAPNPGMCPRLGIEPGTL